MKTLPLKKNGQRNSIFMRKQFPLRDLLESNNIIPTRVMTRAYHNGPVLL